MADPIAFPSTTPTLGLPLLIAGQAQKEFFVNQALSMLDAFSQHSVVASLAAPPTSTTAGAGFRVTAPASGAWQGHEDTIALWIGGDWHFIAPRTGLQIFDAEAGHTLVFRSGWQQATAPAAPSGGLVIDVEARASLAALIQALVGVGLLASGEA
jgi:Protein of unknown function (DUF2793)